MENSLSRATLRSVTCHLALTFVSIQDNIQEYIYIASDMSLVQLFNVEGRDRK